MSISGGGPLMQGGRVNKKNVKKNQNSRKNITKIVGTNNSSEPTAVYRGGAHVFAVTGTKSHGSGLISGRSLSDWGQILFL